MATPAQNSTCMERRQLGQAPMAPSPGRDHSDYCTILGRQCLGVGQTPWAWAQSRGGREYVPVSKGLCTLSTPAALARTGDPQGMPIPQAWASLQAGYAGKSGLDEGWWENRPTQGKAGPRARHLAHELESQVGPCLNQSRGQRSPAGRGLI